MNLLQTLARAPWLVLLRGTATMPFTVFVALVLRLGTQMARPATAA